MEWRKINHFMGRIERERLRCMGGSQGKEGLRRIEYDERNEDGGKVKDGSSEDEEKWILR